MEIDDKIYIAGHKGLVGSALMRQLKSRRYSRLIVSDIDLRNQKDVNDFFCAEKPDYVFLTAAKVGGIGFNINHSADFIRDNVLIQTNVIEASRINKAKKLMFLGTVCTYPKLAPSPIKEEFLMTGPMEDTNVGYSMAKMLGILMCQKYCEQYGMNTISPLLSNVFGTFDNFRINECHVIPSFIRRFIDAKDKNLPNVVCLGDGSPVREFIFSDDVADGLIFLMNSYDNPYPINIGPNYKISIKCLAEIVSELVGYKGEIIWDKTKPNGAPHRVLDTTKMDKLGWKAPTSLKQGLEITIDWFIKNRNSYVRI